MPKNAIFCGLRPLKWHKSVKIRRKMPIFSCWHGYCIQGLEFFSRPDFRPTSLKGVKKLTVGFSYGFLGWHGSCIGVGSPKLKKVFKLARFCVGMESFKLKMVFKLAEKSFWIVEKSCLEVFKLARVLHEGEKSFEVVKVSKY